jgi:hypothetical protein
MTSELFALLLRDVSQLIKPLPVTTLLPQPSPTEIDPSSHPHVNLIMVFSDLTTLFEASASQRANSQTNLNHVAMKLLFYASQTLSTPSPVFRALAQEVLERSLTYQMVVADMAVEAGPSSERKQAPIIEEL